MTQPTEQETTFAYAVMYEAFRAGANRKFTIIFQAESQIDSGDTFQSMAEQVARSAIANGQANSLEDVAITGVSLLNPNVPVADDVSENSDEYVKQLELVVINTYDSIFNGAEPNEELLTAAYEICKLKHE